MFWFKKKESEIEKLQREREEFLKSKNVMFDRLDLLYRNISCAEGIKSDTFKIECLWYSMIRQVYRVDVKTALGWRTYQMIREFGVWNTDYKEFELNLKGVFTVKASRGPNANSVNVEPLLGEDLKAEDIDLAIYELENIFEGYEEAYNEKLAIHRKEVNKLKEGKNE